MKVALTVASTLILLVLAFIVTYISAVNGEARVRNQFNAQQQLLEQSFDRTWKVIKQQASVSETERDSFRDTYVEIMNATEGVAGRGQLASFFTQAKIDVSPMLFLKLMVTIEAQRESFFQDTKKLLEIKRIHDDYRTVLPSSLFLSGVEPLQPKLVSSTVTDEAFSTGKEDDVTLFE